MVHKTRKKLYRPCVGILLINPDKKVLVARRISISQEIGSQYLWQMPQGGINEGETPEQACWRELYEELGTKKARIIAEHPDWLKYDLPGATAKNAFKGKYSGQKQKWFALEFLGTEKDINLSPETGEPAEFDEWRWVNLEEVPELIVPFKRDVYKEVVSYFDETLKLSQ